MTYARSIEMQQQDQADGFTHSTTLERIRSWLFRNREEGAVCPACQRPSKVYRYNLSGSWAAVLIKMYNLHRQGYGWVHVESRIRPLGGNYAKLRFWGLIEAYPHNAEALPDKSSAGYWRVTTLGKLFVECKATIPQHIFIYLNTNAGVGGKQVSITDCLGNKFNFGELMGWESREDD
jgi:hypothetical protein